jgi:hypothetical protein
VTRVQWIAEKNLDAGSSLDFYDFYDEYCEYYDRITFETYKRYCREAFQSLTAEEEDKTRTVKTNNEISVELRASDIRTEEDLINFGRIDTDKWESVELINEFWGNDDNPHYLIKGKYRPRTSNMMSPKEYAEKFNKFVEDFRVEKPSIEKYNSTDIVYELDLFDMHFGQQSFASETGDIDYDPDIAYKMYMDAVDYFISVTHRDAEKYIIVVGQDFFNVDNHLNTTTKGTPQQESGSFRGTFLLAEKLLVNVINKLNNFAEVHVPIVPGNHEEYRMFYMGEFLKAFFKDRAGVTIENSLQPRKYFVWGENLLGYTHGNKEKRGFLPLLMAEEMPVEFSKTKYREWHLGHWHSSHEKNFRLVKETQGIKEKIMGSLVPLDDFHKDKGYRHLQECVCTKYDKKYGPIAVYNYHIGMSSRKMK